MRETVTASSLAPACAGARLKPEDGRSACGLVSSQGVELLSRVFNGAEQKCENGALVVGRTRWVGGVAPPLIPGAGRVTDACELHPVENGLVVRERSQGYAVSVLFPFRINESTWHRFERVPAESHP
jgi:hypothetical protein